MFINVRSCLPQPCLHSTYLGTYLQDQRNIYNNRSRIIISAIQAATRTIRLHTSHTFFSPVSRLILHTVGKLQGNPKVLVVLVEPNTKLCLPGGHGSTVFPRAYLPVLSKDPSETRTQRDSFRGCCWRSRRYMCGGGLVRS